MTEQGIILNRLLDKYENSKHLLAPGTSTRRVMLKVEKKDFPEYSPKWPDGKKHARNVYAHTREECEEKLKVLIVEMKAEIAEAQRLRDLGEGNGQPPEEKKGKWAKKGK